jgi:methanogenic corrinoid protein MtbC1
LRASEATPLTAEEWQTLRADLYQALTHFDEDSAVRALEQAHPLEDLLTTLITPVLVKIGQEWHDGKVSIATEHFASQFLMGHLFSLFNSLPNGDGKLVVAGCAPKELHQIGSLMLAILLRKERVNVRYLGADVPLEDWNALIQTRHPAVVALSCSLPEFGHKLLMALPFPDKPTRKHPFVVLGGMAFEGFANSYPNKPNIYVEQTLASGVSRIVGLLA